VPGRSVGTHQVLNDFIAPSRCHLLRHGGLSVGDHCVGFAAKTMLIELKCCFALAVEQKIKDSIAQRAPLTRS
jgi:hypothetical protein